MWMEMVNTVYVWWTGLLQKILFSNVESYISLSTGAKTFISVVLLVALASSVFKKAKKVFSFILTLVILYVLAAYFNII